jgi:hypothetical protein
MFRCRRNRRELASKEIHGEVVDLRANGMLTVGKQLDLGFLVKLRETVTQQQGLADGDVHILFAVQDQHRAFQSFHLQYRGALPHRFVMPVSSLMFCGTPGKVLSIVLGSPLMTRDEQHTRKRSAAG